MVIAEINACLRSVLSDAPTLARGSLDQARIAALSALLTAAFVAALPQSPEHPGI